MHRRPLLIALVLACACGNGGTGNGLPDAEAGDTRDVAAGDTPDARADAGDVLDSRDAEVADTHSEVFPAVRPVCDPTLLSGSGEAIPFGDFASPSSEAMPFPNLAMARHDPTSPTGLRLRHDQHLMADLLNLLDGTGVSSPFLVPLASPPDLASLPDEASSPRGNQAVFLARTDEADAPEMDPSRLADASVPVRVSYNAEASALVVEPSVPLQERARYALVVTRCLTDATGAPVGRAAAMDAGIDQDSPLRDEMDRALRFLARPDVNVPPESVAVVLPVVTRTASSSMIAAARAATDHDFRPRIEWAMTPALPDGTLDPAFMAMVPGLDALIAEEFPPETTGDYDFGAIGLVAQGTFMARRWFDPEHGKRLGEDGEPVPFADDMPVRFFLTLPREDSAHGRTQPFPTVLFQHAFGVCKETALALAGTFSRMGIATIGIDSVAHGHRAVGDVWRCPIDMMSFLTIDQPVRLWYNFAESAIDIVQLSAMARQLDIDLLPAPDGDGIPDLRTDGAFGLIGQSMGGFLVGDILGMDDTIGPVVINVAGGQEGLFFAWSMAGGEAEQSLMFGFHNMPGMILELMAPMQAAMDDVEPLTLAADVAGWPASRHVLLQQAVEDRTVPMTCGHRLARRLGLSRLVPAFRGLPGVPDAAAPVAGNLASGHTGVLAQFSPAKHKFLLVNDWADRDRLLLFRGQVQAGLFFSDFFAGRSPAVIDPYIDDDVKPWLPVGWR